MSQDNENSTTCKCEYCQSEIPISSALSPEGAEYIFHFCGSDCLNKWEKENKQTNSDN